MGYQYGSGTAKYKKRLVHTKVNSDRTTEVTKKLDASKASYSMLEETHNNFRVRLEQGAMR
jgi:hypothetical protein